MSEARKVEVSFTSSYSISKDDEVAISSLGELEALCAKYDESLIIRIGEDGKLSAIEVYDTYRE